MQGNITISFDSFRSLMADCMQVGYMQAVKAYEPTADYIRETEVAQWLATMHLPLKRFRSLVDAGMVRRKRHGTAANSPWYYSKNDIVEQLFTARAYSQVSSITP